MKKFNISISHPVAITGCIQLKKGVITFLRGETGSGKTTIIYDLMKQIRNGYIYVPQKYPLLGEYTVEDQFKTFSISNEDMKYYLELLHLSIDGKTSIRDLSAGMKQRVAVALALARKPEYLLLDEPMSNLDQENRQNMMEVLKDYARNHCYLLIVDHSDYYKEYAEDLYYLENGIIEKKWENGTEKENSSRSQSKISIPYFMNLHNRHYISKHLLRFAMILILFILSGASSVYSNYCKNKLESEMSTYVLIDTDSIEKFKDDFTLLEAYPNIGGTCNGTNVNIYPLVDEHYKTADDHSVYITSQDSTKYGISIGDAVIADGEMYQIGSILDDAFIPPIQSNIHLILYMNQVNVDDNSTYIGKLKNLFDYRTTFKKAEDLESLQFTDPYTAYFIDYYNNQFKIISYVCIFAYLFILVIYILKLMKEIDIIDQEHIFLKCHGVKDSLSLMIYTILTVIVCIILMTIEYFILNQLVLVNLVIPAVTAALTGYHIYSNTLYLKLIR